MSNKSGSGDSAHGFRYEVYKNTVCGQLILIWKHQKYRPITV